MSDDVDGPHEEEEPRLPTAEESLDEALDHLERILDRRDPADTPAPATHEHATQVEIPLLDDVVLPGTAHQFGAEFANEFTDGSTETGTVQIDAAESEQLSRMVAERLASEIEIIVNEGIDSAVRGALATAQARIRDHLAIVLPEIVDELRHARARPNDDA